MKNQRPKRELGISMQTHAERKNTGTFGSYRFSKAWYERSEAIKVRIKKQIARIKIRKQEREIALKENKPVVYSIK